METLGKKYLSYGTVKKWTAEFKKGTEYIEDDGRSGRHEYATADVNVKVVQTLVMCDRRQDPQSKLAKDLGIRFGAVQSILNDISGMSKFFGQMGAANVDR